MKPTTDIVEELRLYNRWRRGDEAITAPDPTALGKLLDDAADRIEHLFASGIHTCHADCQRPMCVLRRERDKAQNDLARVKAELEHHKSVKETIDSAHKELSREHAALRARVAELDESLHLANGTADLALHHRDIAEQRNAELEAALREIVECVDVDGADEKYDREIQRICAIALARAESATPDHIPDAAKMVSATPAKHPDTERIQALRELCGYIEDGSGTRVAIGQDDATGSWYVSTPCDSYYGGSLDAAIDAAMKEARHD